MKTKIKIKYQFHYELVSEKIGTNIIGDCSYNDILCCAIHYVEQFNKKNIKKYEQILKEELQKHIKIYLEADRKLNKL